MMRTIVGVGIVGIGLGLMVYGMILLLYSINCGDVSFCYEEKSGVILMTFGVLGASVGSNLLIRCN